MRDEDYHPSPDCNADMSEFDGDITDVDVGKHCQEVRETAGITIITV